MKPNRNCPVCNQPYYADPKRLKHGRQTTCSRACSYAFRAGSLTKKIDFSCATCGKPFSKAPSTAKGKHGSVFCSNACHYAGRSLGKSKRVVVDPYVVTEEGREAWKIGAQKTRLKRIASGSYKKTEEQREKSRHSSCLAISENRLPASSKLEDSVVPALDSLGIEYIRQYAIRNDKGRFVCVYDFFIPSRNVAIEVNGTFWHSDPRFYPDGPVHEVQKRGARRWARKLELAASLGHSIIELWEHDMKTVGVRYILDRIHRAIRQGGQDFEAIPVM